MKVPKVKKVFFQNLIFQFTKQKHATSLRDFKKYSQTLEKAILTNKVSSFIEHCVTHQSGIVEVEKKLYQPFIQYFTKVAKFIEAAGGLVVNDKDELLFIYRLEKWDLPKGKIDDEEKKTQAAIREVQEETGLKHVTLNEKFCATYHIYYVKDLLTLKKTHWYIMQCKKTKALKPQTNEGITKVVWMKKKKMTKIFSNTYPLIKDLVERYLEVSHN